jgi:hypothetical protein
VALLDALPADPSRGPARPAWERGPTLEASIIVDLFNALGRIERARVARAADHVLAWPKIYAMDTVLVPASRSLMGSAMMQASPAARRLQTACLDHLRAAVQHRTHVKGAIKSANCDLNLVTERRGSPHSLICTKNQPSYERRVKQRQDDLAYIQHLQG